MPEVTLPGVHNRLKSVEYENAVLKNIIMTLSRSSESGKRIISAIGPFTDGAGHIGTLRHITLHTSMVPDAWDEETNPDPVSTTLRGGCWVIDEAGDPGRLWGGSYAMSDGSMKYVARYGY